MTQEANQPTAASAPIPESTAAVQPTYTSTPQQLTPEPQPGPAANWWHRARTVVHTHIATATVCLSAGALQQLGAHLIEWFW
jgi:hypothetical protein